MEALARSARPGEHARLNALSLNNKFRTLKPELSERSRPHCVFSTHGDDQPAPCLHTDVGLISSPTLRFDRESPPLSAIIMDAPASDTTVETDGKATEAIIALRYWVRCMQILTRKNFPHMHQHLTH